ncbi:MAG: electron transfer flavoprotein subunit alpha/FixB family protein [Acidimicrobiales bacterium]|nr:electron transfer flavoprotein subunit alpha/FixB family protein [Acidimicrobiales bacterium]
MSVLVIIEHDRGAVPEAMFEALTAARGFGMPVHAAVMGEGAADAATALGAYGAETVHHLTSAALGDYSPEAWGAAAADAVAKLSPSIVMSAGTDRGNELMAQVAARMDLPFVANCVEASADGSTMTRAQWGGALHEATTLDAPTKLLSFNPHAVEATEAPAAGAVLELAVEVDASLNRTIIKDRVVLSEGITLATAPVVVSGGRAVGSEEAFAPLEELAAELGGKVGCSRAVTNNGWRPHSDQVGQTGTRIAPTIYIASGISGATQHWVGAMGSKNILAINTDPEANMVTKAGWAVIADLHEVIPAITEEVRKRRG